jgi:hypothetical protein
LSPICQARTRHQPQDREGARVLARANEVIE